MALVPILISENGRIKLGLTLSILNIILTIVSIVTFGLTVYLKTSIEDRFVIVDSYDNDSLSWMLVALSLTWILWHSLGSKMAYDCRSFLSRNKFQHFLMLWLLVLFFLPFLAFTCGYLIFKHEAHLLQVLTNGLLHALKRCNIFYNESFITFRRIWMPDEGVFFFLRYKKNAMTKRVMDKIQLSFACCGSLGYNDWFNIGWVPLNYLNKASASIKKKIIHGEYIADDVPFSCCSSKYLGPCVHTNLANTMSVNNKFVPKSTINERGCSEALIDSFDEVLDTCGYIMLTVGSLQVILFVAARYFESSIRNATLSSNPMDSAAGYFMEKVPCACLDKDQYTIKPLNIPTVDEAQNESKDVSGDSSGIDTASDYEVSDDTEDEKEPLLNKKEIPKQEGKEDEKGTNKIGVIGGESLFKHSERERAGKESKVLKSTNSKKSNLENTSKSSKLKPPKSKVDSKKVDKKVAKKEKKRK